MSSSWVLIVFRVLLLSVAASCVPQVVKIATGEINGQVLKSRNGRDYLSFTGIPYAKPPVAELRFKPPKPADSWEGVWDGTKEPSMCIQINHFVPSKMNAVEGVEDCLYLNVYTPNVSGKKLPVMVWIHGGAYRSGYGGSSWFGPDYFMDRDVVIVTFNYRLGLFGFGSTEDDVMPGNYGLKDQVAALRWVQENVATFGGDPGQVTIFGTSAGGASVGYHMMSPMSKGLFHKAIIQSGSPTCNWAIPIPGLNRKRTEAVAAVAGCHANNSEDVLNCLITFPANSLVELGNTFFEWRDHPIVAFPPVVESCDSSQESFLCNHPITDFKQESFVPTIVGFNSAEGGIFVASLYNDTSLQYQELQTDFNHLSTSLLEYRYLALPEHWDEIGNQIMETYFPFGGMNDYTHSNAVNMISDCLITYCAIDITQKLSSPIYFYLFDYQNEFTFNKLYGECTIPLGVSHGDELISLFKINSIIPQGLIDKDSEVSKVMVNIWTKFASSETPTIDGMDNSAAWPEFTSIKDSSILHIDSDRPKIIQNLYEEQYLFWSKLPMLSRFKTPTLSKSSNIKNEL